MSVGVSARPNPTMYAPNGRWSQEYPILRNLSAEERTIRLRAIVTEIATEAAQRDTLGRYNVERLFSALSILLASETDLPFVLEAVRVYEDLVESLGEGEEPTT